MYEMGPQGHSATFLLSSYSQMCYGAEMDHQGWFIGPNGELLFWVPSYLRPLSGLTTNTKLVIVAGLGSWLDVTHLINGQEWQKIKRKLTA